MRLGLTYFHFLDACLYTILSAQPGRAKKKKKKKKKKSTLPEQEE